MIGKALQDNRLLDLPLSLPLCKILVGHPLTSEDVAAVDPVLGRSLAEMQQIVMTAVNSQRKADVNKAKEYVESLCLDFTLPGAEW